MKPPAEEAKTQIEQMLGVRLQKAGVGRSLFRASSLNLFVYFRYSKIFKTQSPYAFYGLRKQDVDLAMDGDFYVCFTTDDPDEIFLVPFADFAACYEYTPVINGDYKTELFFKRDGVELYIPGSGKFSVESYRGLSGIGDKKQSQQPPPELDHTGAQSLVGAIGGLKNYDVWFPRNDVEKIDRKVMDFARIRKTLPSLGAHVDAIFQEIDVIWLEGGLPVAIFEIEHSTSVYSGLLRINDVLITSARPIESKIVAEQYRRDLFQRQIRRPTFAAHKLEDKVSFISYDNVWRWHEKLKSAPKPSPQRGDAT